MQDTPTGSRRSSLVTQNKPREYTVNAFASGNFVYSPVRTKAMDTGGQTNMDVDERDGSPAILLSSLSRAPASGRPKGPVRTVEDMGLDSEPFTDEELQRLPIFRSSANLVFAHGKPPGDAAPLTFPFELEKADYDACLSWSKQNDHNQLASDLTSLKCVSLSCYHIEECSRKLLSFSNPKPQDIFAGKPNDFPTHLSVYLRIEGQDPPEFAVTWAHLLENRHDQLVDLSKKVRLGTNKIELYAGRPDVDYSQYVFVLRLHSPTPRQAAWWWDRKREQVSWQRTLRRFSHFEMSSIDLSQRAKHTEHTPA
ncbi:uncharacterized protein PHACADRAFT_252994 [Phanerochaete carnosa HHB-10118-sp]|uniref:Uncharacterized protein n=1 Tax=Phanerochaete carnosa (strain HHB-10118-sp) TaxID=650164 RepID=K5X6P8_PHACS|nr:uncharacterized protein PHACADRAFT_252994 [Phanerochaete carnosa HHB-10118-sp]EKM58557.1 hypothetical protein PHACADRAFT_252994 [Phanerochaete carnosa HHB-10118-sp]